MKKDELTSKVIEIVSEVLGIDKDSITKDSDLCDDLNMDELDSIELIMEFEYEFEISIADEDAEKFRTIGDYADYIYNLWSKEYLIPPEKPTPKPVQKITADVYDTNIKGDVSEGVINPTVLYHIIVNQKAYHCIHHYDEQRLEIVERPNLLIVYGDFDTLCRKATEELKKPY